jgi:hypothetical protein
MRNPILIDALKINKKYNHVLTIRSLHDLKSNLTVLYSALKNSYKNKDILEYIDLLLIKCEYDLEQYEINNFNCRAYVLELMIMS